MIIVVPCILVKQYIYSTCTCTVYNLSTIIIDAINNYNEVSTCDWCTMYCIHIHVHVCVYFCPGCIQTNPAPWGEDNW